MLLSRFILFAFRQACQRGEEREYTGECRGGGDGDPVDISVQRRGAYGGNGGLRDGFERADARAFEPFQNFFFFHNYVSPFRFQFSTSLLRRGFCQ